MGLTKQNKFHLYARAGFFAHENELAKTDNVKKVVEEILSTQKVRPLEIELEEFDREKFKKMSRKEKKDLKKTWRKQVQEINALWIKQMMDFELGLIEKMTLFWHGHFACRTIDNPYQSLDLNNRLRKHALGSFRDMLYAVSESPAMINYLHLKQNKKGKPNEDFARELCELFTLGRDVDYTEKDVMEIARAFTGWTVNAEGKHVVNPRQHDNGEKTIFGKTGNFSGKDVLEMILENKHTADFIAGKVYRFFVRERANEAHVGELSAVLYNSNYDLKEMMRTLFESSWFYESAGELIKSPVELLVSFGRIFDLKYEHIESLVRVERYLGQVLFDPPNVAGWAGGRSWIDSSRLAFRLRMGSMIVNKGVVEDQLSPDLDEMITERRRKKRFLQLSEEIDWKSFFSKNKTVDPKTVLLRVENESLENVNDHTAASDKVGAIIRLISTPDFQLT